MTEDQENALLKRVSRSFYLSLRMLPRPMRRSAGLAYLLARASDTLADAPGIPGESRLECLSRFNRAVAGGGPAGWVAGVVEAVDHPGERELLDCFDSLVLRLQRLPVGEAALVRGVLETITSGQISDIRRFGGAGAGRVVALPDDAALDDYIWRVAGCVGVFWTRLGFLTIGPEFSRVGEEELADAGGAFGKGLQLVNILRDLPEDLRNGRCYLPHADPCDPDCLMAAHALWLERADRLVAKGFGYGRAMESRRLRTACVLPAAIARETLDRMRGITWVELEKRVKVPRRAVYSALLRSILGFPPAGGWRI